MILYIQNISKYIKMRNTKKLYSYNNKKYIIITVSENNPPSHIFILGLLLSKFMCVYV